MVSIGSKTNSAPDFAQSLTENCGRTVSITHLIASHLFGHGTFLAKKRPRGCHNLKYNVLVKHQQLHSMYKLMSNAY